MNLLLKFKEIYNSFDKRNIDILVALAPLTLFGLILFGIRAFIVCLVCVASTLIFDFCLFFMLKKENVDYSKSLISGLFLGLMLPPALPLYIAVLGSAFSVFIVKFFFETKEGFIISPALASRIFLQVSFPSQMADFLQPMVDISASATPLTNNIFSLKEILFGVTSGSIGETSTILIILCSLFLIWVKAISWQISVSILSSSLIFSLILDDSSIVLLILGGLLFASFFFSVEGLKLPKNLFGKIFFGFGCGLITVIIREFGNVPEGISYAIVFMGLLVPLIDKVKFNLKKAEK